VRSKSEEQAVHGTPPMGRPSTGR